MATPFNPYDFGQVRVPEGLEEYFFAGNPNVAGMADFGSNTVVLNPYSNLDKQGRDSVATNELSRLVMNERGYPMKFDVTPEQQSTFQGTVYGKPENQDQLRQTLIARIIAGDPSAGKPTTDQEAWANLIRMFMPNRKQ